MPYNVKWLPILKRHLTCVRSRQFTTRPVYVVEGNHVLVYDEQELAIHIGETRFPTGVSGNRIRAIFTIAPIRLGARAYYDACCRPSWNGGTPAADQMAAETLEHYAKEIGE